LFVDAKQALFAELHSFTKPPISIRGKKQVLPNRTPAFSGKNAL
jgi:hypothetical protein